MKLRSKILIFLLTTLLVLVVLISLLFVMILRLKFNYDDSLNPNSQRGFASIDNSVKYISVKTERDCKEIRSFIEERKDISAIIEALEKKQEDLRQKSSYVYLFSGEKLLYGANLSLLEDLKTYFYPPQIPMKGSLYICKEERQYLIRGKRVELPKQEPLSFFIISDIAEVDEKSKAVFSEVFVSMVICLFLAGVMIAVWMNQKIIRPINDLKQMTRSIVKGDLDTEIRRNNNDEVSELCNDFDDMRIHIKGLLEKNLDTEKTMREMMVNISHDLRTPLTAIKGYTMGLLEGVASTPEKQEKYLKTLGIKTDEMEVLIEELSTFAKLDLNYVPYHFMIVCLDDYLQAGIRSEKTDFELQDIKILYTRNLRREVMVRIDPVQFDKVMNNILSNAKKYRKPGVTSVVHIKTFEEGEWVRIDVEDNGKGIKEEHISHIFERFYRVDGSRSVRSGGSGLGLSIAEKIIEKHEGKIEVISQFKVGTTIRIYLKKVDREKGMMEGDNR